MRLKKVLCWSLIVASVGGTALGTFLRATGHEMAGSLLDVFPFIIGIALASLLALRVPDNNMTLVLCAALASGTWVDVNPVLSELALEGGKDALAVALAQAGTGLFFAFYLSLFILLPLWFPTGTAIGPRWEWVGRLAMLTSSVALVLTVSASETCVVMTGEACEQAVATPWGVGASNGALADIVFLIGAAMVLPAVWSLLLRFHRSRGVERQQIKYMVPSALLIASLFFAQRILEEGFGVELFADQLMAMIVTLALASFSLAILRYRLYDIDRIMSRTISYTIVVALLVGSVALVAAVVGTRFESPLVVAATTLGVAALFNPLRRRVQGWVDRRFNRSRYDAEHVMEQFALTLRDRVESDALVGGWVGVVAETMRPSLVGVWVRE